MVKRSFLFAFLLIFLANSTESLKCHKMEFAEDGEFLRFCDIRVILENEEAKVDWNKNYGMDCKETGCEHNETHTKCCCDKDFCNTLEFALVSRSEQRPRVSAYYMVPIVLTVILTKILILMMIRFWDAIRPFKETFARKIHIDLTFMNAMPRTRNINGVPSGKGTTTLKNVKCKAVISYGCDETLTIREIFTPKMAEYGIDEKSTMEEILAAVLKIGPKEIAYDAETTIRILKAGEAIFRAESNVLKLTPPIAIYADMHGQYSDLWRWLYTNGWPNKTKSIFLGDYVDRGRHSTEVFLLLVLLKVNYPKNMFMLRGNHEDGNVNKHYTFFSEVQARFGEQHPKVFAAFEDTFSSMPMSALIGKKIFCMHGGLTPKLPTLASIDAIHRPTNRTLTKDDYFIGILWSDPSPVRKFKVNVARDEGGRGIGYLFGRGQVRGFCKKNKLSLLIRGHQPPMHGYERFSRRLITLFSAPGYRLEKGLPNLGSSLLVDAAGRITIVRMLVAGKMVMKRQKMKMNRGDKYLVVPSKSPKKKAASPGSPAAVTPVSSTGDI